MYVCLIYLCVGHRNILVAQRICWKMSSRASKQMDASHESCVGCRTFQALRRRVPSKRSNFWPQWKFAWLRKICKAGYTGLPECCWHFWLFQSEMLAASAKHLDEFCELLRSMHRDRETYWCAEAVGLLHYTRREHIAGLPTGNRLTTWFSEVSANCPQLSATVRGQKTYSPRCPARPCPRRIYLAKCLKKGCPRVSAGIQCCWMFGKRMSACPQPRQFSKTSDVPLCPQKDPWWLEKTCCLVPFLFTDALHFSRQPFLLQVSPPLCSAKLPSQVRSRKQSLVAWIFWPKAIQQGMLLQLNNSTTVEMLQAVKADETLYLLAEIWRPDHTLRVNTNPCASCWKKQMKAKFCCKQKTCNVKFPPSFVVNTAANKPTPLCSAEKKQLFLQFTPIRQNLRKKHTPTYLGLIWTYLNLSISTE